MDTQLTDHSEEPLAETPEDVAILYSWANLHGAKYRDFSASRREYRAQVRHRAAEEMRQTELAAKADAERAAGEAEQLAREAERAAQRADAHDSSADRQRAIQDAEEAARRPAAAERVEAARRAESAAIAEAVARREEREIAEAHASAQRQAKSYNNSEIRRRALAGPQPIPAGLASDPYEHQISEADIQAYADRQASYLAQTKPLGNPRSTQQAREELTRRASSGERRAYRPEMEVRRRPQGYRPDENSGMRPAYQPSTDAFTPSERTGRRSEDYVAVPPVERRQSISEQFPITRNDAFAAQQRQLPTPPAPGADTLRSRLALCFCRCNLKPSRCSPRRVSSGSSAYRTFGRYASAISA